MKTYTYCLFVYTAFILIACNHRPTENDLIIFDYYKSYPEVNIKLSDVAEIKYIPMKGEELGYMLPGGVMWNSLYIDEATGKIYFLQKRKIYVYDMQGNPLQVLDKEGRGPEEYLIITTFWIEKENNAVYCYSGSGETLVVYDTLFNFKKKIPFVVPFVDNIVRIKGDTLAIYNHLPSYDPGNKEKYRGALEKYPGIPPFFFTLAYSTTQVVKTIPYHLERPVRALSEGPEFLFYPSIIRGLNGVFLTNKCCDTVLWMDNKTMEVHPRFIDITDYRTPECMTIPSFETEKYIFFDTNFSPRLTPNLKKKYFLYDKKSRQIFQIKVRIHEPRENILALVNNQCALTSGISTQNYNYAAVFIQPLFLLENLDNLPDDLRAIAETLNENDNPVLMLIKLKK